MNKYVKFIIGIVIGIVVFLIVWLLSNATVNAGEIYPAGKECNEIIPSDAIQGQALQGGERMKAWEVNVQENPLQLIETKGN